MEKIRLSGKVLGALVAALFVMAGMPQSGAATEKAEAAKSPALLLANVWQPSIDPTGWWMSEKYDGLRGFWDGEKLCTRQGNPIQAPDYFLADLPQGIALDGELWIGRGQFEKTVGVVRSKTPGAGWKEVRFMVFDAPRAQGTFEERQKFLRKTLPATSQFVKQVPEERCRDAAHLLAERDRVVAAGGEGLMLRRPESAYEAGRSPTLLKVKPQDDAEATVIAHLPGQGRLAGSLGALRVKTADGREFSVGAGLTDAQRAAPPAVGTVITYRFRGLTDKGLPRFPTFLRVRRD